MTARLTNRSLTLRLYAAVGRCACLLAAIGCLLLNSEALAGCGDYVVIGNPQGHPAMTLPAVAREAALPGHAVPAAPCHGPGCRQGAPLPVPAAPGLPMVQRDTAACASSTAATPHGPARRLTERAALVLSDGHARRIDRPPRG